MEQSYELFADFHQFFIRDAAADWGDLPDRWTPDAVERMFVQGDGYVAVGTARDMPVPVVVRVTDSEPPESALTDVDRTEEGVLALHSGELVISGVTDNGASGGRMSLPAGAYRVRVLYRGLDSISYDGLSGEDSYEIELWRPAD